MLIKVKWDEMPADFILLTSRIRHISSNPTFPPTPRLSLNHFEATSKAVSLSLIWSNRMHRSSFLYCHSDIKTSAYPGFLHLFLLPAQSFYLYLLHSCFPPSPMLPSQLSPSPPSLSLAPLFNTKCPLSGFQVKTPTLSHHRHHRHHPQPR